MSYKVFRGKNISHVNIMPLSTERMALNSLQSHLLLSCIQILEKRIKGRKEVNKDRVVVFPKHSWDEMRLTTNCEVH